MTVSNKGKQHRRCKAQGWFLHTSQKEPKLDRARKIPEWEEYDREVARFARSLQKSNAVAAIDVEVLASPESVTGPEEMRSVEQKSSPTPAIQDATQHVDEVRRDGQTEQHRIMDEL